MGDASYIQYEPRKMLKSSKFSKVACAYDFSLGLTHDGAVYGWGKNMGKQSNDPKPIEFSRKVVDIAAGANHCAVVDEAGSLFTWGSGGVWHKGGGQLGHNSYDPENSPRYVTFYSDHCYCVCIETHHADIYCREVQYLLDYGAKIKQVACGAHHTVMLTTDGEVLACGMGEYGRLGVGSSEDQKVPSTIRHIIDEDIVQVAASHNHSACLTADGRLFTWGKNDVGQLGHPDTYMDVLYSQETLPRWVESLPKISQFSLTRARTAVVTTEGQLYIWGAQFQHIPTLIEPKYFDNMKVSKVLCAGGTNGVATLVVTEDGSLWSFGDVSSWILSQQVSSVEKTLGIGKKPTPARVNFATKSSTATGSKLGKVVDIYGGLGRFVFAKLEVLED